MFNRNFGRFIASSSFIFVAFLFHTNSAFAQHPCDTFANTTCTVPGALETWTIVDDNTTATNQTGDDFTTQIGSHAPNGKTLWYRWTSPKTRVYVLDTKGTNTNAIPVIPVLDTTIKVTVGGTLPTNTTLLTYNQDWNGVSLCSQFLTTLRGTEHIRSSCLILYANAGTTYNFQVDGQNDCCSFPTAAPLRLNLRPLLEPTAANATISGKILTSQGRGIKNVQVSITNLQTGETRNTITTSFGNYTFEDLPSGNNYLISVNSKRYIFSTNNQTVNLTENLSDVNFVGEMR
jgi:hypothetical protein